MKKNGIVLFIFYISYVSQSFAQDVILQGYVHREVEKAQRLSTVPKIDHTIQPQPVVEYPLLMIQYHTTPRTDSIRAANIKIKEQHDQLYSTHIKLGIGSKLMPLGEIDYTNLRSRKYRYGACINHLSSLANIPNYERNTFSRTKFGLFGEIINKKYQLSANYNYNLQNLHYYAIQSPIDSLGKERTKQRYSNNQIELNYKNSFKVDSLLVNYQLSTDYNNLQTLKPKNDSLKDWYAKENWVVLNGKSEATLNENIYAFDIDFLYNNYKYGNPTDSVNIIDTALSISNAIVRLKPHITTLLWNNRFRTIIGLDFTIDAHKKTNAYIYPNIEVKYSLFNDLFIPYAGLRGHLTPTTLQSLVNENEFLQPNVILKNENTSIDFYGGMKGTLSKNISFHLGISYAYQQNVPLFISDTVYSAGNRFDVLYESLQHFLFDGSISYQKNEKLKIDLIGKFHSYELKNQAYAWNKPTFEFTTSLHYNLYDKIYAHGDFTLQHGRKALVYSQGKNVYTENAQLYRKLEPIADVNISLEYRYTRRFSVFVQFNNIIGKRYQRWYNAPVHGFQLMAGITFRF